MPSDRIKALHSAVFVAIDLAVTGDHNLRGINIDVFLSALLEGGYTITRKDAYPCCASLTPGNPDPCPLCDASRSEGQVCPYGN